MDHAIADSHATVTISHRAIRSHQTPQRVQCRAFRPYLDGRSPPRTPCPILARGGVMRRKSRVSAVRHAWPWQRRTPGSGPTSLSGTSGTLTTSVRGQDPEPGVTSNVSSRTGGPGPPASAPRAARTPRRPAPRPVAAAPRSPRPRPPPSGPPSSCSGRQRVHQPAVVQLDQRARVELLQPAPHVHQPVDQRPLVQRLPQRPQRPRHPAPGLHHRRAVAQHRRPHLARALRRTRRSSSANEHEPAQRHLPRRRADPGPRVRVAVQPPLVVRGRLAAHDRRQHRVQDRRRAAAPPAPPGPASRAAGSARGRRTPPRRPRRRRRRRSRAPAPAPAAWAAGRPASGAVRPGTVGRSARRA